MKFSKEDLKAGKHMEARKELGRQLSKIRMRDGPYHNSGVNSSLFSLPKHSFISLECMVTSLVNIIADAITFAQKIHQTYYQVFEVYC